MSSPHTVVSILEAKKGKENALAAALGAVVEPSQAEEACIEYRLHRSIENTAQFILYENWASKEKHQEQFTKPYITALAEKIGGLLSKPYQTFFASEIGQ